MVPNCPQVIKRDGLCWRGPRADTHGGGSCSLPETCTSNDLPQIGLTTLFILQMDAKERRWCLASRDGRRGKRRRGKRRGGERGGGGSQMIELLILFSCFGSGLAKPIPNRQRAEGKNRG